MKKILLSMIILSTMIFAENNETNNSKSISDKQLEEVLKQEQKFATEQKFYSEKDYDFKGSEVNKDSLDSVPLIEMDDPSLDSQSMLGMEDAP